MKGSLIILLTLYLLQALVAECNHLLSPVHIHLYLGGLCVPLAALILPYPAGLAACILAGALLDAASPLPFGTQALLLAAAHAAVYGLRGRIPRDETPARVLVAACANLLLFAALTAATVGRTPVLFTAWPRLVVELVWSEAALVLIAPWFFSLQSQSLNLGRAMPFRRA